jgi:K+-sensing histidine kinase KdpD
VCLNITLKRRLIKWQKQTKRSVLSFYVAGRKEVQTNLTEAALCFRLSLKRCATFTFEKKGVVKLKSDNVADALLKFACENEITHVIFGQSARLRWQIFLYGSIINRFLSEVKDAAVHVIPIERE